MKTKGKLELAFHKDRELPVMTDLIICISVKLLCLISADGHFSMDSQLICPEINFVRYLGLNP